jgi:hypothetical protein
MSLDEPVDAAPAPACGLDRTSRSSWHFLPASERFRHRIDQLN